MVVTTNDVADIIIKTAAKGLVDGEHAYVCPRYAL
jgi:hypothetical protein